MTPLIRTARATGAFYLLLAVTGGLGFMFVRSKIFVAGDAAATFQQLTSHPLLARFGVACEMGVVISQSLAALWFFKLFRSVHDFEASLIAVFGMVNSVLVLFSSIFVFTALDAPQADTVFLLYRLSGACWDIGGLFFGLWLIPMGTLILRSRWMPRALGYILILGGISYIVSPFISVLAPRIPTDFFALPATVGEFWIIGYLIIFGVREPSPS